MTNPLLTMLQTEQAQLPPFTHIKPMHVEPAIDQILKDNRQQLNALLEQSVFNWENLVQPLEEMSGRLQRAWSPVSHMNSVMNSDELREAYNQCLPKLSEYSTELGQNEKLYQAYQSIADAASFSNLDIAQQKIITNALRDFHLSGVDLEKNKKQRFKEIKQQLSKLKTKFEENILDATHAWHKLIKHEKDLSGLPEFAVAMSKQAAEQKELDGWVFTLDAPSYMAVMMYADDRDLREEMYREFVTRASDQGSNAGEWDNSDNMQQILALRHELAELLSFSNYAELSLATKMAETTDDVLDFLNQLTEKCKSVAGSMGHHVLF